jgi:hypothetical protein
VLSEFCLTGQAIHRLEGTWLDRKEEILIDLTVLGNLRRE